MYFIDYFNFEFILFRPISHKGILSCLNLIKLFKKIHSKYFVFKVFQKVQKLILQFNFFVLDDYI